MKKIILFALLLLCMVSISTTPYFAQEGSEIRDTTIRELGINDKYNGISKGVKIVLSYDFRKSAFIGSVENMTTKTIENISIRVILSSGLSLESTVIKNFLPGDRKNIILNDNGQMFNWWIAHATKGSEYSGSHTKSSENNDNKTYKNENYHIERSMEDVHKGELSTEDIKDAQKSTQDIRDAKKKSDDIK